MELLLSWLLLGVSPIVLGNPDAKRLYDDLLSNYNRLIRPVGNNSDRLTVKMGLRLSQLIDVVSINFIENFKIYTLFVDYFIRSSNILPNFLFDNYFSYFCPIDCNFCYFFNEVQIPFVHVFNIFVKS